MNNDQVKGGLKEVGGKIKEGTGKILDDESMKNEGRLDQAKGSVQRNYGNVKEDVKDAIDKV